jgi:hypothetical protein
MVSQRGEERALAGLSIRGYACHREVSHTAVREALAAGRMVFRKV